MFRRLFLYVRLYIRTALLSIILGKNWLRFQDWLGRDWCISRTFLNKFPFLTPERVITGSSIDPIALNVWIAIDFLNFWLDRNLDQLLLTFLYCLSSFQAKNLIYRATILVYVILSYLKITRGRSFLIRGLKAYLLDHVTLMQVTSWKALEFYTRLNEHRIDLYDRLKIILAICLKHMSARIVDFSSTYIAWRSFEAVNSSVNLWPVSFIHAFIDLSDNLSESHFFKRAQERHE
jgi:hypothetical protein